MYLVRCSGWVHDPTGGYDYFINLTQQVQFAVVSRVNRTDSYQEIYREWLVTDKGRHVGSMSVALYKTGMGVLACMA